MYTNDTKKEEKKANRFFMFYYVEYSNVYWIFSRINLYTALQVMLIYWSDWYVDLRVTTHILDKATLLWSNITFGLFEKQRQSDKDSVEFLTSKTRFTGTEI